MAHNEDGKTKLDQLALEDAFGVVASATGFSAVGPTAGTGTATGAGVSGVVGLVTGAGVAGVVCVVVVVVCVTGAGVAAVFSTHKDMVDVMIVVSNRRFTVSSILAASARSAFLPVRSPRRCCCC